MKNLLLGVAVVLVVGSFRPCIAFSIISTTNSNHRYASGRRGQNDNDSMESSSAVANNVSSPSWIDQLDGGVLNAMKQELVEKYRSQGLDEGAAEDEVDAFFRDKDQAEKYVEMRMYTAAVTNDVGPGTVLQLIGGFLLGFLAIVGPKLFNS